MRRIGWASGASAFQAPTCSISRRGPSASATVRTRPSRACGRGSTTAIATPAPSACLTAAAKASPAGPAPATTMSKMREAAAEGMAPLWGGGRGEASAGGERAA